MNRALESLQRLLQAEVQKRRKFLREARSLVEEWTLRCHALQAEIERMDSVVRHAMSGPGQVPAFSVHRLRAILEERLLFARNSLAAAKPDEERARLGLLEARRGAEAGARLLERRKAERKKRREAADQHELDDLSAGRHRKMQEESRACQRR